MAERCLQMINGSCKGCPVRDVLLPNIVRFANPEKPLSEIAADLARVECPEGTNIQLPERRRIKVW